MRTKVLTILGTRPEIIRLSLIMPLLDSLCDHTILHTGQNYTPSLGDIFFEELKLRKPDIQLSCNDPTLSGQLSHIFKGVEEALKVVKPDKVLILGDTNSALAAVICERLGFPVYHMEAGNRCYDLKVPEEKNRKIVDAISSYNMPYTPGSRENLIREGIDKRKIFTSGNPIKEVMEKNLTSAFCSAGKLLGNFGIRRKEYILVTAHRAENVDIESRLVGIFDALNDISNKIKVIFSCHPRTKDKMKKFNIVTSPNIRICDPFGFADFLGLEHSCAVAITDSGTVQEECCILNVPTITIRDTTERPETVECGSNTVSGVTTEKILEAYRRIHNIRKWELPIGYSDTNVSSKVVNFILQENL